MQENFIEQTPNQREAFIFQTNLASLQRLSLSELISEKLNSLIHSCIEYAATALSTQECIERFRKIAYSLFSHSAVQNGFRRFNMSLQLLRMVIYDTPNANSHVLANVLKNLLKQAIEDLKETLKKEECIQNENINSIKPESTRELFPFNNLSEDNLVTVSFGTGKDFYHGLKENKLPGYNLEGKGISGIFVSPHNTISKASIESRTKYYANKTPLLYFDKPVGITFTIAVDQLFYINHNSYEAIIRQEDLSKVFSSQEIKECYYNMSDFGEKLPPYLFAESGKNDIEKLFDQDTSQFLISCLNNIEFRLTSPYSRSYSL